MLSVLQSILCVLKNALLAIAWAGVEVVNLLVAALGLFAAGLIALMPSMPDVPELQSMETARGWLSWAFPVAGLVAVFFTMLTAYALFLLVRIALRWVKAL